MSVDIVTDMWRGRERGRDGASIIATLVGVDLASHVFHLWDFHEASAETFRRLRFAEERTWQKVDGSPLGTRYTTNGVPGSCLFVVGSYLANNCKSHVRSHFYTGFLVDVLGMSGLYFTSPPH